MDTANTTTFETWKPIVGWEEYYEVSSLGRIRKTVSTRQKKAGLRKANPCGRIGYWGIMLWRPGRHTHYRVHRLVAEAFLGPRPKGYGINHIDGDKNNNTLTNLEYVTGKQNSEHASRHGLMAHGERHYLARLNTKSVVTIRRLYTEGMTITRIAQLFGRGQTTIEAVVTHRTWRHINP